MRNDPGGQCPFPNVRDCSGFSGQQDDPAMPRFVVQVMQRSSRESHWATRRLCPTGATWRPRSRPFPTRRGRGPGTDSTTVSKSRVVTAPRHLLDVVGLICDDAAPLFQIYSLLHRFDATPFGEGVNSPLAGTQEVSPPRRRGCSDALRAAHGQTRRCADATQRRVARPVTGDNCSGMARPRWPARSTDGRVRRCQRRHCDWRPSVPT